MYRIFPNRSRSKSFLTHSVSFPAKIDAKKPAAKSGNKRQIGVDSESPKQHFAVPGDEAGHQRLAIDIDSDKTAKNSESITKASGQHCPVDQDAFKWPESCQRESSIARDQLDIPASHERLQEARGHERDPEELSC